MFGHTTFIISHLPHCDMPFGSKGRLNIDPAKGTGECSKDVLLYIKVQPTSQFLDLPREIRDHIYILMFLSDVPVYPSKDRAGISEYLGVLRTNRQIYSEAVEILYSQNTFQIRGTPGWKAPELLNLLSSQRRNGFLQPSFWAVSTSKVCLARHYLRKLYFPSHNISLDRLKHLFSLLKYFPNLDYLRVVYNGSLGLKDMDVVSVCRLFRDRRPLLKNFVLCKRIRYTEAEDISWMISEKPFRNWSKSISDDNNTPHLWKNQDGVFRQALVINAPQSIPE